MTPYKAALKTPNARTGRNVACEETVPGDVMHRPNPGGALALIPSHALLSFDLQSVQQTGTVAETSSVALMAASRSVPLRLKSLEMVT